MADKTGAFASSILTFLSRSRGLRAAALLAVLGACSSSLGPGADGGGGSGGESPGTGEAGTSGTAGAVGRGGAGGPAGTTGTAGIGGTGGGCFHPAPTEAPFNCRPTYAEGVTALCAAQPNVGGPIFKHAGSCESFRVTLLSTSYWMVSCAYDGGGALVGARRCEEGVVCGSSACIDSTGPSDLPHCDPLTNVCGGGSGGAGGSTGT